MNVTLCVAGVRRRVRCMRDVDEVHTTVCRHYPSAFLCEKQGGGGLEVRTRSEFSQYQAYERNVQVVVLGWAS